MTIVGNIHRNFASARKIVRVFGRRCVPIWEAIGGLAGRPLALLCEGGRPDRVLMGDRAESAEMLRGSNVSIGCASPRSRRDAECSRPAASSRPHWGRPRRPARRRRHELLRGTRAQTAVCLAVAGAFAVGNAESPWSPLGRGSHHRWIWDASGNTDRNPCEQPSWLESRVAVIWRRGGHFRRVGR